MLEIDVNLYSFQFNHPFIDDCIKIVFKNVFNKKFFLKHEFFQIKNLLKTRISIQIITTVF